jgi:hypothetical protein
LAEEWKYVPTEVSDGEEWKYSPRPVAEESGDTHRGRWRRSVEIPTEAGGGGEWRYPPRLVAQEVENSLKDNGGIEVKQL